MEAQEIFDTVVRHLFNQGHAALDNGRCRYRAANGDKCAAGVLITDEYYDPKMEGRPFWLLKSEFKLPDWLKNNSDLVEDLQDVHDYLKHPAEQFNLDKLEKLLQTVAKNYGLTYKGEYR